MSHRLLDIDDALVSEANPASSDNTLDVDRCVRLHNYLVALGWMARHQKGPQDLDELLSRPSYFETYGQDAEAIRGRLDPSLVVFLESVIMNDSYLFIWASGFAEPGKIGQLGCMVGTADYFPDEDTEVRDGLVHFILLYETVFEMGSHSIGVVYDQEHCRVAFPFVQEYTESVIPVEEHQDMWYPLETMLSKWVHLIHIGKIGVQALDWKGTGPSWDVWRWHSYSSAQVDSAVAAMDRLTDSIEARMPPASLLSVDRNKPLLSHAHLDAACVPDSCFIRSFMTRIKTPRFIAVAPGLEIPYDVEAFVSRQAFTTIAHQDLDMVDWDHVIPPLLIFAASADHTVELDFESNPFPLKSRGKTMCVAAGLYSESIGRADVDTAEEGFRLLLPYRLRETDYHDNGARKSDGSLLNRGTVGELFQHGFLPFGGEHRAQRLERLLDHWRGLIERGVWAVGPHGVEGTIDKFKDADEGHWQDYRIPPDW